jgi:hypothetical protein
MFGECKAGHFATNIMVACDAKVCRGGHGQSACKHLRKCRKSFKKYVQKEKQEIKEIKK